MRTAAAHLEGAVHLMREGTTRGAFAEHIAQIKVQEERGDAIYQDAVGALFAVPMDPLDLIKWKDIYDRLEDATDECQHAAQVAQSVALKHA